MESQKHIPERDRREPTLEELNEIYAERPPEEEQQAKEDEEDLLWNLNHD